MEKEYICICGKVFNNPQAFNGHKSQCKIHQLNKYGNLDKYNESHKNNISKEQIKLNSKIRKEQKLEQWIEEEHRCEHCGKIMAEFYGSGRFCSEKCARSRKITEEQKRKISKKLTKNIPKYCKNCGKLLNNRNITGYCKYCFKKYIPCSDKTKEKLRIAAINRDLGGSPFKNCILYNDIFLDSNYEYIVAKSLDENHIKWERPQKFIYFENNNINTKRHTYTPDFYLPEYNIYLDPKNDFLINNINPSLGYKDSDKIKWVEEYNNINIIILNKNQLLWEQIYPLIIEKIKGV